jgi:hypothetical protein
MTFNVEILLKGRDTAVNDSLQIPQTVWDDEAVRAMLVEVLAAISRAENTATSGNRVVLLQGFSWIVEPLKDQVVLAIEIPMGAAVAGPFAVGQAELDAMITRVLRAERQTLAPTTIH